MRAGWVPPVLAVITLLAAAAPARAAEPEAVRVDPFATKPGYVQIMATVLGGTGLRFNNPFRLAKPLGSDAESVSRSAAFVDLGLGATFGDPLHLQHGLTLRTAIAVEGVGQVVMAPSYLAYRRWGALAAWGRAGVPLVLSPDATWGLEAAAGGAYWVRGGIGVAAEIVGDVFYGAGTADVATVSYPLLSGQLGLVLAYEVFP